MAAKGSSGRTYGISPTRQWRALRHHKGDKNALLVAAWLRCNRHSTMLGLYHCPALYPAAELGLDGEEATAAFWALGKTKDPDQAPWQGAGEAPSEALRAARLGAFALWDERDELVWVVDMAEWEMGRSLSPKDHRYRAGERLLRAMHHEFPGSPLPEAFRCYYTTFWGLPLLEESPLEAPGVGASKGLVKGQGKGVGKGQEKPLGKPAKQQCSNAEKRAARAREAADLDSEDEDRRLAYAEPILSAWHEVHRRPILIAKPKERAQIDSWRKDGIPAAVVAQVIRERGPIDCGSLRYYGEPDGGAVADAWREQESALARLQAPATSVDAQPLAIETRIERLVRSAETALGRCELLARLESLDRTGTAEEIEQQLADLDSEMLAYAESQMAPGAREELERRVEESVAGLSGRLVGRGDAVRRRAKARLLRDSAGLPLLALFSPDALEESGHA